MCDGNKSLRIDWFDGTVIEEARPSSSFLEAEENVQTQPQDKFKEPERKAIGFKRLLDISTLQTPMLNMEIANRAGFWILLENEVKDDFLVLMVKIFAAVYKSVDPSEDSKIVKLLRTKFETSNFIQKLTDYVKSLPKVRISQKRSNFFLWNDVESFFYSVLDLCNGIFNFGNRQLDYLIKLHDLVETALDSAIGVQEEHTESIGDSFYRNMNDLKLRIYKTIHQIPDNEVKPVVEENKDPNYYKNLSIFPNKDDLFSENKIPIVPHIINGAYPSVDHYLDLQFKLLREDCFGPLRDGLRKYSADPSKRRYENIRVYPKVRVICYHTSSNRIGYLVDLCWIERLVHWSVDCTKYAANKQLMYGSLLLFTSDNFQTILCASVLESSVDLLQEGYVAVSFESPVSDDIFSQIYLMIESEVYFEPYHRVLRVLQEFKQDNLPMKQYVVDVQTDAVPPAYLTSETLYKVDDDKLGTVYIPVIEPNGWPPAHFFGLDESQMNAFKFALSREFAVIQGPPGTGKTFIGTKIASMILKNLSLEGTPMLIICYTNYALDQFLEGILEVTNSVVRLGSQSKSEKLEPYNLNNLRSSAKSSYGYLFGSKRAELEGISRNMSRLKGEIDKCEREIISYKTIKPYLSINGKSYELKNSNDDAILTWLFGHLESDEFNAETDLEDWEKQFEDITVTDKILTCFSQDWALKEIDSMRSSIKYIKDVSVMNSERSTMIAKFENQITKYTRWLDYFKKQLSLKINRPKCNIQQPKDLYELTPDQRWIVYFDAADSVKRGLVAEMNELVEKYRSCSASLDEVSTMVDSEIIKTARVVGVTTTVAARRHDLMRKLMSPIVIVEEAAEVLEAHVIASLTHRCQHLILIGDHKQLKPSANHYILAKHYNLEISLFERMIRNGIHARTLTTQRRMRENFVELLVPTIYPQLDSHPSVRNYPNVAGMTHNLYFCTHQAREDTEGMEDSWSHRNIYEAKWCISLANYLRRKNYTAQEITILATYTGQANLMKELSNNYKLLQDVIITVVDNYQGKENRIIILSLVRSNQYGQIGFLSAANRICVALSRAKEGFYIFGNMDHLKSSSAIWRRINEKLEAQNAIGPSLLLRCDKHNTIMNVKMPQDLDNCLKNTCLQECS